MFCSPLSIKKLLWFCAYKQTFLYWNIAEVAAPRVADSLEVFALFGNYGIKGQHGGNLIYHAALAFALNHISNLLVYGI